LDITVVIPTYNRQKQLKDAITSVLTQSYQPKEIIVVDDGSTDATAQITKDFPTIRYFYKENGGVSSARNLGIAKANFEWIAFLDSDDRWHEDKLKEQVAYHKANPTVLMSYTDEVWIRNGKEKKIPKKFEKKGKDAFLENISYCNIAPSSVLIHRRLFEKVGLFDESMVVCEDYDLWLRIAQEHKIALIDKKLTIKYAGHDDQLSFLHWKMNKFHIKTLQKLLSQNTQSRYYDKIVEELAKKEAFLD